MTSLQLLSLFVALHKARTRKEKFKAVCATMSFQSHQMEVPVVRRISIHTSLDQFIPYLLSSLRQSQTGDRAACQGFLIFTFGPVGALTSFEFSESGRLPLNTDGQSNPKPTKLPPRCRHAHSFRILPWIRLGILPLNPHVFFHYIVPQVRPSV